MVSNPLGSVLFVFPRASTSMAPFQRRGRQRSRSAAEISADPNTEIRGAIDYRKNRIAHLRKRKHSLRFGLPAHSELLRARSIHAGDV